MVSMLCGMRGVCSWHCCAKVKHLQSIFLLAFHTIHGNTIQVSLSPSVVFICFLFGLMHAYLYVRICLCWLMLDVRSQQKDSKYLVHQPFKR